jgi:hypothetical protein
MLSSSLGSALYQTMMPGVERLSTATIESWPALQSGSPTYRSALVGYQAA